MEAYKEYREINRIFKLTKEALIKELIELKFGIENEEPVKGEKQETYHGFKG